MAKGQIKSLSTRDENHPAQASPLAESEALAVCPSLKAEACPTIQPWEPFNETWIKLSAAGPPPTKGSSQERRDEISGLFVSTSLTENKHPHLSVTH